MSEAAPKYAEGDLVWAKMKGFSPWPGKVADPSKTKLKKPAGNYRYKKLYSIYFFGTNNFAWIPEDSLKPYAEFRDQYAKSCKTASFKDALSKIDEFSKTGTLAELAVLEREALGEKSDDGASTALLACFSSFPPFNFLILHLFTVSFW